MKTLKFFLLTAIVSFSINQMANAQKVRITTTVNEFQTTSILLGCPSYNGDAALIIDLATSDKLADINDEQVDRLEALISAFETENGVHLRSKTKIRDFVLEEDRIDATTRGPLSGAGKELCDYVKGLIE
ncbi:MAG: hypothetical protein AAF502_15920 [Bacteroidota bacterium]